MMRIEHANTYVFCRLCGMQGPKVTNPGSCDQAVRLWDNLPRRVEKFASIGVGIPEIEFERTRPRVLDPFCINSFLGRPISYWIELDSYAKANMYDKLIERNVSLDSRVLALEAKVAHQEEIERVRAMQWHI